MIVNKLLLLPILGWLWLFLPVILAADCVSFCASPDSHWHPRHVQQAVRYKLVRTTNVLCIITGIYCTGDAVLQVIPSTHEGRRLVIGISPIHEEVLIIFTGNFLLMTLQGKPVCVKPSVSMAKRQSKSGERLNHPSTTHTYTVHCTAAYSPQKDREKSSKNPQPGLHISGWVCNVSPVKTKYMMPRINPRL